MTNSADPDQLTSSEANGSGSSLFAKTGHVVYSKRRVKAVLAGKNLLPEEEIVLQLKKPPAEIEANISL